MACLTCVLNHPPPVGLQPGSGSRHCGGDATAAPSLTGPCRHVPPGMQVEVRIAGSVAPITDFGGQLTIRIRMPVLTSNDGAVYHLSPISGIDREAIMGDLSLGGKRTSDGRLVRWCSAGSVVLSWSGGAQLAGGSSVGGAVAGRAGRPLGGAGLGGRVLGGGSSG